MHLCILFNDRNLCYSDFVLFLWRLKIYYAPFNGENYVMYDIAWIYVYPSAHALHVSVYEVHASVMCTTHSHTGACGARAGGCMCLHAPYTD